MLPEGFFMRRIAALGVVGVLASALVFLGAPAAFAVEPPPPPVQPVGTLPSMYKQSVLTGSQLADNQIKFYNWVRQQEAARRAATAVGTTVSNGVPITQAAPLKAATAGTVLTGAFIAGWMITDGTLAMYANATGTSALAGTCAWGDFGVAAVEILYPFSSPDCTSTIDSPNAGLTAGKGPLTYSGMTLTYTGNRPGASGTNCYNWTGTLPAGFSFAFRRYSDNTIVAVGNPGASSGYCAPAGGGAYFYSTAVGASGTISGAAQVGMDVWVRQNSNGALVASMPTLSADPGRIPKCDLTWPDGSHTMQTGLAYHESGGVPMGVFNGLCNDAFVSKPGHGPGLLPSDIKIGSTREDTGAYTEIADAPVPDFSPSEEKGLTPGTTAGGLVLEKVVGTLASSCMNWDADCADWWADTANGTDATTDEGTYRCTYNGSTVDLLECGPYRHTFDTRTENPTITDPNTGTQGEWLTAPDTAPGSSTSPGNSINPGTGPGTSPGDACMASWPAAPDPLSWVLHPVKCALVWAFVPRATVVQTKWATATTLWETTMPGQLPGIVEDAVDEVDDPGGCLGPPVSIAFSSVNEHWPDFNGHPLAACEGAAAAVATFTRTLGAAALIYITALGIIRRASATVNAPGLGGGSA